MHQIAKDICWVGYIDWNLREFHGYTTPSGSTYNSYLILDEKPALIDTVKHYGYNEMLARIKEVIDPSEIRYIISNHTEMDHSGSIDSLLTLCPQAEVVCSPKGAEGLRKHFKKDWKFKVVTTGDTLSLGRRTLTFHLAPMVHWPDSMATYSESDCLLFSNDAFGQHYASSERYADEIGLDIVCEEAAKYYANIVLPYGAQVVKVLQALSALNVSMICPSHGLLWRREEDIKTILGLYDGWARYTSQKKVVIIYDTMWHSTETMAYRLFELLEREQINVKLCNLGATDFTDAITDIMRARVVMVGSPILNNHVLPRVGGFLTYVKGLKPAKRYGFTFGSYGWATGGFKELENSLQSAGIELFTEGIYTQYVPDEADLESLRKVVGPIKDILKKEQV